MEVEENTCHGDGLQQQILRDGMVVPQFSQALPEDQCGAVLAQLATAAALPVSQQGTPAFRPQPSDLGIHGQPMKNSHVPKGLQAHRLQQMHQIAALHAGQDPGYAHLGLAGTSWPVSSFRQPGDQVRTPCFVVHHPLGGRAAGGGMIQQKLYAAPPSEPGEKGSRAFQQSETAWCGFQPTRRKGPSGRMAATLAGSFDHVYDTTFRRI